LRPNPRNLTSALVIALLTCAAAAVAKLGTRVPSSAAVAIALIAVAPIAADAVRRSRTEGSWWGPTTVALSVILAVAGYLVASGSPSELAAMIPILGSCAVAPFLEGPPRGRPDGPPEITSQTGRIS
jgi:hypothetical protein